jgi:hypothetical protein
VARWEENGAVPGVQRLSSPALLHPRSKSGAHITKEMHSRERKVSRPAGPLVPYISNLTNTWEIHAGLGNSLTV